MRLSFYIELKVISDMEIFSRFEPSSSHSEVEINKFHRTKFSSADLAFSAKLKDDLQFSS